MNAHWGKMIAAVFGIFVLGMVAFVIFAMSQNIDLVTEQPYERGLVYQQQIGILQRTATLERRLELRIGENELRIVFPLASADPITGTVLLYRPADRHRDLIVPADPDSAGIRIIPVDALDRGLWRVKVAWEQGGKTYYDEQPIMLY